MSSITVKGIGKDVRLSQGGHLVLVPAGAEVEIPAVLTDTAKAVGLTVVGEKPAAKTTAK